MHSKNYIILIIFTSYVLVYLMLIYTDHTISEKLNTVLHQEEEEWKLLESLDPFKSSWLSQKNKKRYSWIPYEYFNVDYPLSWSE